MLEFPHLPQLNVYRCLVRASGGNGFQVDTWRIMKVKVPRKMWNLKVLNVQQLPTQPWNPHTPMPSTRGSCFTFVVAEISPPVTSELGERAFESLLSRWISTSAVLKSTHVAWSQLTAWAQGFSEKSTSTKGPVNINQGTCEPVNL